MLSCKASLYGAVQMEAVPQPFFQIPQGITYAVDRANDVIPYWRNVECKFLNPSELMEEAFAIEKPGIGHVAVRAVGCSSSHCCGYCRPCVGRAKINLVSFISMFHQGDSLRLVLGPIAYRSGGLPE